MGGRMANTADRILQRFLQLHLPAEYFLSCAVINDIQMCKIVSMLVQQLRVVACRWREVRLLSMISILQRYSSTWYYVIGVVHGRHVPAVRANLNQATRHQLATQFPC